MTHLWKLVTLFALIATLPSPTQASPLDSYGEPSPASAPETNNDDPLSPSPNSYPSDDEEDMAPESQAPGIEEDYPYAENPFHSPSEAPNYLDDIMAPEPDADDVDDEFYYSPYEAPSPTESTYSGVSYDAADIAPATPPVFPFSYSAEDDSGGFSDEEEYPELKNKKNRAVIGFVMGAICLVGLGGLVYKKQKNNQKRDHPMYVQLSKKTDV